MSNRNNDDFQRIVQEILERHQGIQQRESPNNNSMGEDRMDWREQEEARRAAERAERDARVAAQQAAAKKLRRLIVGGASTLFGIIIIWILIAQSHTVVKPGHGGVQYSLFGGLKQEVLGGGMKWHAPWTNVYQYPTSTEIEKRTIVKDEAGKVKSDDSITVNTGDGKSVKVAYTYNYSMEQDQLPHIFTKFRRKTGPQIADQYIDQQFINTIQNIATSHSVLEVYSQDRAEIQKEVFEQVKKALGADGIVLEEFTIVDVVPDEKTLTVLQQIADEQNKRELVIRQRNTLAEEEKNIVQQNKNNLATAEGNKAVAEVTAQQNAATALIEAEGQAKANRELSSSLTPQVLEMKKLEVLPQIKFPTVMGSSGSILNMPESLLEGSTK